MIDPKTVYPEMRGQLQRALALPLEGKKEQFREFLVGYPMVECNYSEARARRYGSLEQGPDLGPRGRLVPKTGRTPKASSG